MIKHEFIQSIERAHTPLSETICVRTRLHAHEFGMFRKIEEASHMMEQIANFAAKK
jgi:hypothetical protein